MNEPKLSERAAMVARTMLRTPEKWHNAGELAATLDLSRGTVSQILSRLYVWGWVHDRGVAGSREFQFTSGGDELASEALEAASPDGKSGKVTTLAKMEQAVKEGKESQAFLDAVRRRLAGQ